MKNIVSLLAVTVLLSGICTAQKPRVPGKVTEAFAKKFPQATQVRWGKENATEYEAEFKMDKTDISANFGVDGTWKETETTIAESELPSAVKKAVMDKYPDASIRRAERIEKPALPIVYEVNIKTGKGKKELELSSSGAFIQ